MMHRWKTAKKIFVIIAVFLCVCLIYSLIPEKVNWEYKSDFDYECRGNGSEPSKHMLHYCIKGPRIFFTETSGSTTLNARQACAVESTVRNNPSLFVSVLMTPSENINFDHPLLAKLITLPNLRLTKVEVDVLVHGSPVWKWLREGKWKKSKWKVSHLSDALRFFLVWKYGGMYLDLDIVTLRSMEQLKNSIITENWDRVASGILIFDKGHNLMKRSMFDFAKNYDPFNFVNNGPGVVTRNIRRYCNTSDIGKVSGANCNVNILSPETAFPIPYDKWEDYFIQSPIKNISQHFNSSYMIHVWNKFSKVQNLKIGTNSIYELAIKEHCPIVYDYARRVKYI